MPFLSPGEHFTFYRQAVAQGKACVETVRFELDLPNEPANHFHVMAFAPLQHIQWGVAVGGDLDETFAGVRRLRLGLALLSSVTLTAVWLTTLISTRKLIQPIRRIIAALRPGILDRLGLVSALEWVRDQTLRPLGISVTLEADDLLVKDP